MIKIGMIGISEGNGHPYSFSSIINGYNDFYMSRSGWNNIYSYLKKRDMSDFGIFDAKVTHIWTQSINDSYKIAKASNINYVVSKYEDMLSDIDAIIIARDDYQTHKQIASIFLEAGKFVFVDKPLSLDVVDLKYFRPFLESGHLMSCSGFKYAVELDIIKESIRDYASFKLVRGATINNWDKYGIHILDGIFSVMPFDVKSVRYNSSNHESFILNNFNGSIIQIDALGCSLPILKVEFFSDTEYYKAELLNVFDAFKRTLWHFVNNIKNKTSKNNTNGLLTLDLMKVLIAGNISKDKKKVVELTEVRI